MFLTAFYDKNQNLQTSYSAIIRNYLRGWFLVDVLSVMPFEMIGDTVSGPTYNRLFRLLRLPRLYSLMKFLKFSK
jgi:hypothetical protein